MTRHRIRAFVALGSNLGRREANLRAAVNRMKQLGEVTAVSELHATGAVAESGVLPTDPDFLNAAAVIETRLDARTLLNGLLRIEASLGRDRTTTAGPRTIDLDLLLFGDLVIEAPGLVVPHPRMHRRRFVLEPLCQIAPNAWHPGLAKTATKLAWNNELGVACL